MIPILAISFAYANPAASLSTIPSDFTGLCADSVPVSERSALGFGEDDVLSSSCLLRKDNEDGVWLFRINEKPVPVLRASINESTLMRESEAWVLDFIDQRTTIPEEELGTFASSLIVMENSESPGTQWAIGTMVIVPRVYKGIEVDGNKMIFNFQPNGRLDYASGTWPTITSLAYHESDAGESCSCDDPEVWAPTAFDSRYQLTTFGLVGHVESYNESNVLVPECVAVAEINNDVVHTHAVERRCPYTPH